MTSRNQSWTSRILHLATIIGDPLLARPSCHRFDWDISFKSRRSGSRYRHVRRCFLNANCKTDKLSIVCLWWCWCWLWWSDPIRSDPLSSSLLYPIIITITFPFVDTILLHSFASWSWIWTPEFTWIHCVWLMSISLNLNLNLFYICDWTCHWTSPFPFRQLIFPFRFIVLCCQLQRCRLFLDSVQHWLNRFESKRALLPIDSLDLIFCVDSSYRHLNDTYPLKCGARKSITSIDAPLYLWDWDLFYQLFLFLLLIHFSLTYVVDSFKFICVLHLRFSFVSSVDRILCRLCYSV